MAPIHNGIWGQALLASLQTRGFSPEALIGNSGIDVQALSGDEPKVQFEHLALLFERAAELTGDDLVGFRHAQNREIRRGGLIAFTGISSPSALTLLQNLARYQRMIGEAVEIDTSRLPDDGVLKWHYNVPSKVKRRQFLEFNGTGIVDTLRRLTGRQLAPRKVGFRHFRKTNTKPMEIFFGCNVEFGCDDNRIEFHSGDLDLPLRTSDDYLYQLLRKFSDEALSKLTEQKASVEFQVEVCIAADLTRSQAQVARELGMSARTLSRRLQDAETTFAEVVEGYRASMAKSMLAESDLQVTEIAYVLGYSDLSTFSAAFKRWTDQTPTGFRGLKSK